MTPDTEDLARRRPTKSDEMHDVDADMQQKMFRHSVQRLPQELQDHILDLVLQENGRFQGRIKHFTRHRATAQTSPSTSVLRITDDYRSPLALQINQAIRNSFAQIVYDHRTIQLEWNELSPWLSSLAPEHMCMLRQVQLNMYPELRLTRLDAQKYCDICFDMLTRDGVKMEVRLFGMLYFDRDTDALGVVWKSPPLEVMNRFARWGNG